METRFTKGPWEFRTIDGSLATVDSATGETVAQAVEVSANDRNSGHKERVANAHLIAAAPELYEALDRVLDVYGLGDKDSLQIYEDAAAEFCAATGRLAPGKDSSPHAYVSADHQAETSRMWSEFCTKRRDDAFVAARAALAKARGEAT